MSTFEIHFYDVIFHFIIIIIGYWFKPRRLLRANSRLTSFSSKAQGHITLTFTLAEMWIFAWLDIVVHYCPQACLRWGCTGKGFEKQEKELCQAVAEGIDYCPDFASSGNLTDRVQAANCYTNFLRIDTDVVKNSGAATKD